MKTHSILPAGWSLKSPWLKDDTGYQRHILDKNGRIDRGLIALILENHSHRKEASTWRLDSELAEAVRDVLPDLERFVSKQALGPDKRLERLKAALCSAD